MGQAHGMQASLHGRNSMDETLDKMEQQRALKLEAYYQGVTFSKDNPYLVVTKKKNHPQRKIDNTIKTVDGFSPPWY